MSTATDLLAAVRSAGAAVAVEGGNLRVRAPHGLPRPLLDALRARKTEVLQALTDRAVVQGNPINPDLAIARWLVANPPENPSRDRCAGCGEWLSPGFSENRPLGDGAWVHYGGLYGLRCYSLYQRHRRAEAMAALGIKE